MSAYPVIRIRVAWETVLRLRQELIAGQPGHPLIGDDDNALLIFQGFRALSRHW